MSQVTADSPTQARLLDAAVASFAVRGFHGTTTRDIAAAAGLSPAAVYVHHRSKEDLLHLISSRGHERTLRLVRDTVAAADGPVDRLAAFARTFAAHHARNHTTARVVNYELAALSEPHRAEVAAVRRAIEAEVRTLVEDGVRAGVFDVPGPADDHARPAVAGDRRLPLVRRRRGPHARGGRRALRGAWRCGWSAPDGPRRSHSVATG